MNATAGGFAAASAPLSSQAISTDTMGLVAVVTEIPVADGNMPVYRAMPEGRKSPPIILVVQEIFGVHEHIRDVCRRFAKAGYLAVAPELYFRQGDASKYADIPTLFEEIVSKVPDAQVMADLDATLVWATKQGGEKAKTAISGFCWGGRITWMYAAHNASINAGVAWYGGLIKPVNAMTPRHPIDIAATLKVPVLGLYGAGDTGIPVESVEKMQAALAAAGSRSKIHLYPDTPHAFYADYRPSYRQAEAADGWKRCLEWLAANDAV